MTTATRPTKATVAALQAQLDAAMATIAAFTAAQATATAQTSSAAQVQSTASNRLADKTFARPIIELIRVDADYRSDEEVARGITLSNHETGKRAVAWAWSRVNYWKTQFEGAVAPSAPTYVPPVSGAWPADHNGFVFGDRVSGTYIAIY